MGQSAARKFLEEQNLNIDSKRFSRKQNVLPDNVFLFETLHVTPRRHICLTQAVILSPTSDFFATVAHFAMTFDFKSKLEQLFTFFTSLTHSSGPLRKLGLSSLGSKGHVCWL